MSSLFPLSVVRIPEKRAQKERVVAGPVLERLRPVGPSPPSPAPSQRPSEPKQPSAETQARAILLAARKRDSTISPADAKWLANYHAPQRGEFESPARRIETEKLAKAICLVGKKVRGEISPADAHRLEDHFAEMQAIELLR